MDIYGMMRAGTDQEGEEQWCRGLSQPPKEYITWIHYITRIHHMSQPYYTIIGNTIGNNVPTT